MANYNKCILAGFLTRDPELTYTPKGIAVTNFGLGINRSWTDESGTKKEEATFVDMTAFGKTAESIGKYFRKGSPILVEGRLKLEQWDDKQTGQKRSKLKVIVESFQFMGNKPEEAEVSEPQRKPLSPSTPPLKFNSTPDPNDDVPF